MAERSRRIRLEDLAQGMRVDGLVASGPVTILTTVQTAPDAFTVVFTKPTVIRITSSPSARPSHVCGSSLRRRGAIRR